MRIIHSCRLNCARQVFDLKQSIERQTHKQAQKILVSVALTGGDPLLASLADLDLMPRPPAKKIGTSSSRLIGTPRRVTEDQCSISSSHCWMSLWLAVDYAGESCVNSVLDASFACVKRIRSQFESVFKNGFPEGMCMCVCCLLFAFIDCVA